MSLLANIGLRTKLFGAFGVVLVVLIVLSSSAYRTTALNQEATDAVTHSFQVISLANAAFASLLDMQTGYRGYLLTGDAAFLQPYLEGNAQVDDELAELRELTTDDPSQAERWRTIEEHLHAWREEVIEPGIALRRDVQAGRATPDEITRWVTSGAGRERFLAMRTTFDQALAVEERLLIERQEEASARRTRLLVLLALGSMLAVGLAIILALLLSADLTEPVRRLAITAREIADGRLDQRIGLRRGDEIGVAAAAFDQMTEQLQTTIVRSQTILDTAAEGILGLDRSGNVTFANPAAAALIARPADALIGLSAAFWIEPSIPPPSMDDPGDEAGDIPPGDGEPAQHSRTAPPTLAPTTPDTGTRTALQVSPSPISEVLDTGAEGYGTGDLIRPGGEGRVPIEYACAPIRSGDQIVGAVLTFRDVTERRAAERALEEHTRELARSNAELEQFAYVASHDLQEPLRAIVSYLQLLERRYADQLDERAERYIGHAVEGGHRMQTLISDLLAYSRVGRRDIVMAPVDLDGVLERVLASLRISIEESAAEITHDPLPTVTADAGQLSQLFQNLVGNAIKFHGEAPPRIHISASHNAEGGDVLATSAEAGHAPEHAPGNPHGAWLFSVRDNGIGIAPEYRERVFVLFQRLHGRDEYSGTGIGLAICKKIVERHGGTLWVEDTPGGGSTFWFTIPDRGTAPDRLTIPDARGDTP